MRNCFLWLVCGWISVGCLTAKSHENGKSLCAERFRAIGKVACETGSRAGCSGPDVEDLAQTVALKWLLNHDGRPWDHHWVRTTARNAAVDIHRDRPKESFGFPPRDGDEDDEVSSEPWWPVGPTLDMVDQLGHREQVDLFLRALVGKLKNLLVQKQKDKTIAFLLWLRGHDESNIRQWLNLSATQFNSALKIVRAHLKIAASMESPYEGWEVLKKYFLDRLIDPILESQIDLEHSSMSAEAVREKLAFPPDD